MGKEMFYHKDTVERMTKEIAENLDPNFCFGYGAKFKKGMERYEKYGSNRWMRMFTPRMIQLGCCCTYRSQLYVLNGDDVNFFFKTVDRLKRDLGEQQEKLMKDLADYKTGAKEPKDLEEALRTYDLPEKFKMDDELKKFFWAGWALPIEN